MAATMRLAVIGNLVRCRVCIAYSAGSGTAVEPEPAGAVHVAGIVHPTPYIRLNEVLGRPEPEWYPHIVAQGHALGVGEHKPPTARVGFLLRSVQLGVEGGIVIAPVIVAAVGTQKVQEDGRVVEIGEPGHHPK